MGKNGKLEDGEAMNNRPSLTGRTLNRALGLIIICALFTVQMGMGVSARYISPDDMDPMLPGAGTNRYAYAANDPVNKSDPNGHLWGFVVAFFGAMLGGTTYSNAPSQKDNPVSESAATQLGNMATGAFAAHSATGIGKKAVDAYGKKKNKDEDAKAASLAAQISLNDKQKITRDSVNEKLDKYLLNPEHPEGGPKANWFEKALGFTRENSRELSAQLNFDKSKAVQTKVSDYGVQYNQIIDITGANGKTISITTGWIEKDGVVRFVTAIPR